MGRDTEKYRWSKASNTRWVAAARRGYTARIDYAAASSPYTLTITGAGAPAPAAYHTLRIAKNAWRKFLFTKKLTHK